MINLINDYKSFKYAIKIKDIKLFKYYIKIFAIRFSRIF